MKPSSELLKLTRAGLFCEPGSFFVDPRRAVERAVITHAHGDHTRRGCREYICSDSGAGLFRERLGPQAIIRSVSYGEVLRLGEVRLSLHPAGHLLGSSQVRVEHGGEVWVVSGDYKRQEDPSCEPFEVVPCDTFITEATFASPVYRWRPGAEVAREILEWWEENRSYSRTSILIVYALGKAQRVLGELTRLTDRRVFVEESIQRLTARYREAGVRLLPTESLPRKVRPERFAGELVLAPPTCRQPTWIGRFPGASTAMASGWMMNTDQLRRLGVDRGFVLSDHADWEEILRTIREVRARRVLVTHGQADELVAHLRRQGVEAEVLGADSV